MIKEVFRDEFPPLLREINDMPKKLFIEGSLLKDEKYIAIVGTRKCSSYGKRVASEFASELAQMGITIVSGLAIGIDTFAHKAALDVQKRTVAVLGCGLNHIYPPENRSLAKKIAENGAVISEYEPDATPTKFNFPQRNRIISGMSMCVIVVEAPEKSGALITARYALNHGREVFVVPGDIHRPQARGTLMLLKEGAHPLTKTSDIFENLQIQTDIITHLKKQQIVNLTAEEDEIFGKIPEGENVSFEKIMRASSLHISKVQSTMSLLEIRGLITRTRSGTYMRSA